MIKAINCKQGSAWHEWQNSGAEWAITVKDYSDQKITEAAQTFANVSGWPQAGIDARNRAFIEGVKLYARGMA